METWLQQVKAIAALAENQDSVLSTHTTTPFPTVYYVAYFTDGKVEREQQMTQQRIAGESLKEQSEERSRDEHRTSRLRVYHPNIFTKHLFHHYRQIQVKTARGHHLTPIRMAAKTAGCKCWQGPEETES